MGNLSQEVAKRPFTSAELENSAPFDPDKRLRGEAGSALLDELLGRIEPWELATGARRRKRKPDDTKSLALTMDVLLANLAALWLNRVDATRFLAVSFNANDYRLPLSLKAMQALRNWMEAEGLIEVAPGFQKVERYEHSMPIARRTRLRATPLLIEEFEGFGIGRQSLRTVPMRGVILIRNREEEGDAPPKVQASAAVIEAVNARLSNTTITLPDDAWARIGRARVEGDDDDAYRAFAGDHTAKTLRRIFSKTWDRGGRIYGGWWMHVPKAERQYIHIDGEPVVEWDYSYLHPALLFARTETVLDFDPYTLKGVDIPSLRDLGKRTFQRLVNRDTLPTRAAPGDANFLPSGMTFKAYLALYLNRLSPITRWLGVDAGMGLQREDSDLAVDILMRMNAAGITALPVHDSVLVQERHSEALKKVMRETYRERYGTTPGMKVTEPGGDATLGTPGVHN